MFSRTSSSLVLFTMNERITKHGWLAVFVDEQKRAIGLFDEIDGAKSVEKPSDRIKS